MSIIKYIKRLWRSHATILTIESVLAIGATACFFGASNASIFTKEHWDCYSSYFFSIPHNTASLQDCNATEVFYETNFLFGGIIILAIIYIIKWFKLLKGTDNKSVDFSFRQKLWKTELKTFCENINLTSSDRITLYFYVSKTNSFFKVSRESPNHKLKKKGRSNYINGVIQQAFHEQEKFQFIDADPNIDKKAYCKEVMKKSEMSKKEVDELTMLSRALYGRMIKKLNGDQVGVLLIETLNKNFEHIECLCYEDNGIDLTTKKISQPLTNNRLRNIFDRECRRLSHYMDNFDVPDTLFEFEEANING